ncbi:MAG: ferrous iron transport protein B [Treponema sp.]|jgi:ferrous iron transport protein B|nr:ferrous iron transport protein B [Treponema sp.]
MKDTVLVALAGNPNSGKTTLFNALTGLHHHVGNYPGVTVEKREGIRKQGAVDYHFVDLPGIYGLTAYSVDEVVARDFLLEEKPDVIINVLDSTNLERSLYTCLQFQELGIPVIGALNMSDEAEAQGIRINVTTLSSTLGIPFVKTVGSKGIGLEELCAAIEHADTNKQTKTIHYGSEVESQIQSLQTLLESDSDFVTHYPARFFAIKLLEKDNNVLEHLKKHPKAEQIKAAARQSIQWIEKHFGKYSEIIVSEQRYGYIHGAVVESVDTVKKPDFLITENIDKVIMNRFLALPIFVLVLWTVFQLTFAIGDYPMQWLETLFSWISDVLNEAIPSELEHVRSLIVDGIIAGVGGVLSFVPLIVILFFLLSLLEDLGYMARAAFATDKILHSFGLHGQSVFPMMLGFGCSVPAILASRTLKNPRDRILTVLITPLMSCGAKLPVHVLLAAAFFPEHAPTVVMILYAVGVVLSLLCALLLKKTVLRGDPTPFVMELPPYRAPTFKGLMWHVWEKTIAYVKKAGTIILASAILIWVITTFPQYELSGDEVAGFESAYLSENPDASADEIEAARETFKGTVALEQSYAGRLGHAIQPLFRPLGFDWKLATASVTGFAAKEVIVSTLGILYRVGTEEDEESIGLRESLAHDPALSPLVAFVFMLFTLIIPPCFAALATVKAEIGWKWLCFELVFLLVLGFVLGTLVYQIGRLI